ncbi:MAG TPA: phosphonate C-P lyase system protein PhnG [Paracoccaceae bacterium]|nr:phosphonate C-P lyase system protein PhnG [Paracoccaceae bacterium]
MTQDAPLPRQTWMSLLARAAPARLAALMPDLPDHALLRSPEIGAVMVRGRVGGTGAPFNLGEVTVTRCSVRLACGTVGHAWVQGRDKAHATRAALADALMQTDAAPSLQTRVLDVLASEAEAARATRAAKAAATKVDFFTLMRGDNA